MRTLRALLPLLAFAVVPAFAQTITTGSLPNGVQNQNYSVQLSCSNCEGFSFGLVNGQGSLPPGLSISPGGTISGIPSAVGTYTFQVALYLPTEGFPTGAKTFTIVIPSGLTILTTSFPAGTLNVAYNQPLSASGGVPPYSWSITQGALPPGLGIANNNSIVGTPTAVGVYNFTISVFDSQENGAFSQTSITINTSGSSGATITTTTLPNGVVGVAYSTQLTCSNCTGYTWSVTSGLLPLGLSLSSGGGLTGTPTTAGGSSFQVTLSPPPVNGAVLPSVSQIFNLTVNAAGLGIAQSTLPIGFAGTPYSTTLTGTGGLPPYTWTLTSPASGNDGLTIGASSGTISGTPTASGTFFLSVLLADSSGLTLTRQFTLSISTGLSILTTSLPNGSVGTVYPTQTLSAGGGQPPYRWTISNGTLPAGLALDGVFGRISGTPTANGKYPFTLTVTDNQANTATANLSITIGAPVTITITPTSLPGGTIGTSYSQTLTASGGTAPYTWSNKTGTLPAGLTLNTTTGTISGTPTTVATSSFTIQATDANQSTGQAALSIAITAASPLTITTASLPNGTVGAAYTGALAATGGVAPYTWSIASGLPAGLTLNASTGAITGTPTAAATSNFTVKVTDSANTTATKALGIVIAAAASPLTITTASLPNGTVGTPYSQILAATGGVSPYTWSIASGLPAGLTLNASTGAITGTPTAAATSNFTVKVTDSANTTATKALSIVITSAVSPIVVTQTGLPAATVGTAYSQTPLTVSGGTPPYTFTLTSTNNDGLTISKTGTLSGTPTSAGQFILAVLASDSGTPAQTSAQNLTLTVNTAAAPTVTLAGVPATSGFQQQLATTPTLSATYPSTVTGTVVLTFTPSVTPPSGSTGTIDDNMIQFSSGGRTATFTIAAGSTTASNLTVLTGTTAGTITLTTTLTLNGATLGSPTTQTIVNAAGVPFISKVTLQQVSGGVTVVITGFSSTRDMVNASFAFAPATGDTFTSDNVSVPVQTPFATWYANTAQSNPYGTQFTLTVPFTLATATQSVSSVTVVSVTVTLQNSKGASNPVTLSN
jgi:large repetitive protein